MNLFRFIKDKVSIVDVVNEYTQLRRAGLYLKARCPFHDEKDASFTVSPHKEIFYCFGCQANGDCISFIARIENCSPLEAARFLADRYRLDLPEEISRQEIDKSAKEREDYHGVCRLVARWAHEQLLKNEAVMTYLSSRSISRESIDRFQLGYFPGGLSSVKELIRALQANQVMAKDLVEAHILEEGQRSVLYSAFEERVIFPIRDHLGRNCGFGGRTYKPGDMRPKYYNSREGAFFTKGSLLFGLDVAKRSIQKAESLFLVEGYVDCIAMVQHGYHNTVATLGTACTAEHLKQLARYAQTVYVLYDGDAAGQQAMIRLADLCWQSSLDLRVVSLPNNHDPASFLAAGLDLEPYITESRDLITFFVCTLGAAFNRQPLQEKMRLARRIIEVLMRVADPLKQDLLVQEAANAIGVPFATLKREVLSGARSHNEMARDPDKNISSCAIKPEDVVKRLSILEKRIFFAIMNNIQLFNEKNEDCLIKYFCEPLRTILVLLKSMREQGAGTDFVQFFDTLSPEQQALVTKIVLEAEEQVTTETFECLFAQFQKRSWKVAARSIALQLDTAKKNNNQEAVARLLQEFLELKRSMVHKNIV